MPLTARQRSIHNKNGAKRSASFNKGKRSRKSSEGEFLYTNAPTDLRSIAYPGGAVALVLLLAARIASAYYGHIADCDETYNYWEPLHYLVYGNGLQTWEYSPVYAIRSYMPLWLFAVPAKILSFIMTPVSVFYSLKALLAILTACAELMFYKAVCHEFGVHVARVWLALTLPAAGSFVSAAAMLPSSWSSSLITAALACWWRKRYQAAVMLTAASVLLSWPFTVILGIPIAIDMIFFKGQIIEFIKWTLISLILILLPTIAVDSWHYGRLVIAPWNIVAYNIFTEHGPDLYGIEPWTYYFVNGFLNFNIVWVLALSSPLLLSACTLISSRSTARASFCAPYWLSSLPLVLWLFVFMLQPHKEERFLYPVYSMIILSGAISIDCLQKMTFAFGTEILRWRKERERRHYLVYTGPLVVMCVVLAGLGSMSRIIALYNYSAPMSILKDLDTTVSEKTLCFGKEWHRSPSSFHLPDNYVIRFVDSEFKGQLPVQYGGTHNATRLIHPYFNDKNTGDNRTYVPPLKCHYLVDSDLNNPTELEPHYHKMTNVWEIIKSLQIMNASKSSKLFRAFYIPIVSKKNVVYANFYLLKNKLIN